MNLTAALVALGLLTVSLGYIPAPSTSAHRPEGSAAALPVQPLLPRP